jgi:hypothetical protein
MNSIIDDDTYSIEERLEMAKILLSMRDKEIVRLETEITKLKSKPAYRSDYDLPWEYNRQ